MRLSLAHPSSHFDCLTLHSNFLLCTGKLHLHHSLENAFGLGIGITRIKNVPSLSLIVATGSGAYF